MPTEKKFLKLIGNRKSQSNLEPKQNKYKAETSQYLTTKHAMKLSEPNTVTLHKDRVIEHPEVHPHSWSQLVLDKGTKNILYKLIACSVDDLVRN